MQKKYTTTVAIAAASILALTGCTGGSGEPGGESVDLVIESWRAEDAAVWEDTILPAFHESHPGISVTFAPTNATEYDAALRSRLEGDTAGDLITCRSGSITVANIDNGYLESIDGLAGLDNFDELTLGYFGADGSAYCVPVAGVLAGFFYNKEIFDELGLTPPETLDEFHDVLEAVAADGQYTPLASGSSDAWITTFMGLYNIGPSFWNGEEGRQALIDGSSKFTDPEFVAALAEMQSWAEYMPAGQASVTYADATQLFALGQAAVFPSGSWDILAVTASGVDVGVFGPPTVDGGEQFLQSHPDMGMGLNAASEHPDEAKTFLEWLTTDEFAALYSNALPGFFGMGQGEVTLESELAQEWADLKIDANLTPRLGQFELAGGTPSWETTIRSHMPGLLSGSTSPDEVAAQMQAWLETWYTPQQ